MRAREGGASIILLFPTPLPVKKSFAKKIFGLNLTLTAREARGIAHKQWASIAEAHCLENKKDLSLILVDLYSQTRKYFSHNLWFLPRHTPRHSLYARMTTLNPPKRLSLLAILASLPPNPYPYFTPVYLLSTLILLPTKSSSGGLARRPAGRLARSPEFLPSNPSFRLNANMGNHQQSKYLIKYKSPTNAELLPRVRRSFAISSKQRRTFIFSNDSQAIRLYSHHTMK